MLHVLSAIFGIVLSASAPLPAYGQSAVEIRIENWQPAKGDRFLADTKENIGYVIHENGSYARFLIATGRQETVSYIGRRYDATTPEARWVVKSKNTQGDRITFGPKGLFLRLYKDGDEYTSYGIHDYAYIEDVLYEDTDGRFFSMGCILVRKAILDLLEETYELNGNSLEVVTTYGFEKPWLAQN